MRAPFVTRTKHEKIVAQLRGEAANYKWALAEAERSLSLQMRAATFCEARAEMARDPVAYVTGRRLRVDMILDDRMIVPGMEEAIRAAVADQMAYKARQAVLSIEFGLAKTAMEAPR